jgi:hypothetical protein
VQAGAVTLPAMVRRCITLVHPRRRRARASASVNL